MAYDPQGNRQAPNEGVGAKKPQLISLTDLHLTEEEISFLLQRYELPECGCKLEFTCDCPKYPECGCPSAEECRCKSYPDCDCPPQLKNPCQHIKAMKATPISLRQWAAFLQEWRPGAPHPGKTTDKEDGYGERPRASLPLKVVGREARVAAMALRLAAGMSLWRRDDAHRKRDGDVGIVAAKGRREAGLRDKGGAE